MFPFTNNIINHFTQMQVYHQKNFIELEFLSQRMRAVYILIDYYRCPYTGDLTTYSPIQFGQQNMREILPCVITNIFIFDDLIVKHIISSFPLLAFPIYLNTTYISVNCQFMTFVYYCLGYWSYDF